MKINRKFWPLAIGATCLLLGAGGAYLQASQPQWLAHIASGNYTAQLGSGSGDLPPEELPPGSKYSGSAPQVRAQSLKELKTLWRAHDDKPIVQDVLPFATHPLLTVQLAGVKMLGRLEDPAALKLLQSLDKNVPPNNDWMSQPYGLSLYPALPLAIGRIKSRDLKGQEKIEVMLSEVGLSFEQFVDLSQKLDKAPYKLHKMGNDVLWEVVDVLYSQKKKGEDIPPLTAQIQLRPAHEFLLQTAQLPVEEAAESLVDYLSATKGVGTGDESELIDYLVNLGPKADAIALDFSKKIFADHQKYPSPVYYVELLKILAKRQPNDPRFKPLFLQFYKYDAKTTSQTAGGALYDLYGLILKP